MSSDTKIDIGDWDYVIVGAGSAGCVLANRLSKNPKNRVLLLEAGGQDTYPWIHIPIGYLYTMNNPRTDWCFSTEPSQGLNGRSLAYPRGKVLGGCSSINGMIYARGQSADYDHWATLGNKGWSWDDVLPYFKKSEDHFGNEDEFHATGGELRVEQQRLSWPILDAVRDGAQELELPKIDDFNRGNNLGSSYFAVNQRKGVRWSTARAFLNPAKHRPNLKIATKAQVKKLNLKDGRVHSIVYDQSGSEHLAIVKNEAVLCSGAVATPQLLQLSGIGDPDQLKRFGIEAKICLPGVGQNLQDHLQLRTIFKVQNTKTLNEIANSITGKISMAAEYLFKRSGPLSMAPSQLGIFSCSSEEIDFPDLEYHVQPLSLDKFGEPLHRFPAITVSVCNLRPTSRGSINIRSTNYQDAPIIQPNYLSTDNDRQVAIKAIRQTRSLTKTRALKPFVTEELLPGADIQSDADLLNAAGDIGTTIFHPVGTAKMGDDALAVVDNRLRVHGVQNLRVADASIMPTITSGNTNAPVIMIAEKAADMILRGNEQAQVSQ